MFICDNVLNHDNTYEDVTIRTNIVDGSSLMPSDSAAAVSAFVEGAPPGEVFPRLPTLYRRCLPSVQLADVITGDWRPVDSGF